MDLIVEEGPIVALLRSLVKVQSVNPGMDPSSAGEEAVGDVVASWGDAHGFRVQRQIVHPGRLNVLVDLGLTHLPTLAFVTHLDTVPEGDLTERARAVSVKGGRVYGRGACDAKGSLAAMLTALQMLGERKSELQVNVQVAAMVDEEHTFHGVLAYLQQLDGNAVPACAVVGEPTLLEVVVAHKGVLRCRLKTIGRAAHTSRPADGINAVDKMIGVLTALKAAFAARFGALHPLLGAASLTVTRIEGGIAPNVVPPTCVAAIDWRLLPGAGVASALNWLDTELERLQAADPELQVEREEPFVQDEALETAPDHPLVQSLLAVRAGLAGASIPIGVPFGTDGSKLSAIGGIPTVILGPGSISQAHTADEWIEIEQLIQAAKIYAGCALAISANR